MAYIYAILVDGLAKYIGKGTDRRAIRHLLKAKQIVRACFTREAIIRATGVHTRLAKAIRKGSKTEIQIIADSLSDDEAFQKEIEIIASFSPGQLWNKTPGGDRPPKHSKHKPSTIEKIKASNLETWNDPKLLAEQSARKKADWQKPEYRTKMHEKNIKPRPGGIASAKARWARPEFREKMEKFYADPVNKKRRSENGFRAWRTRRAKSGQLDLF